MQSKVVAILAASSFFACGAVAQMSQSSSSSGQSQPKMTMSEATKIALQKEPGKITSKELENEGGKQIYSFDIKTSSGTHEVNIDANDGSVIADQVETKADEMKEAQQDKMADKKMKKQHNKDNGEMGETPKL